MPGEPEADCYTYGSCAQLIPFRVSGLRGGNLTSSHATLRVPQELPVLVRKICLVCLVGMYHMLGKAFS